MSPKKKNDRAERVAEVMATTTAAIVDAIEQGIANPGAWRAPWHHANPDQMTPTNAATGNAYTGGNRIALAILSMATGCPTQWATFAQWSGLSKHSPACRAATTDPGTRKERRPECGEDCTVVHVERGQKAAAYVIRPATAKREDEKTGEAKTIILGWNAHAVFHAGQVAGWTAPRVEHPEPVAAPVDADDIADAFHFAAGIGARVVESPHAGASYSPTLDHVTMPDRDRFTSGHGAWSTMAHELTHWTGHPDRLARTFGKKFGDRDYAAEELCAEMGAAFTLAALGRSSEPREDHAHYLAHWLEVLKSSPDALWHVAGRAEKAAAYLVERSTYTGSAAAPTVAA